MNTVKLSVEDYDQLPDRALLTRKPNTGTLYRDSTDTLHVFEWEVHQHVGVVGWRKFIRGTP